MSCFQIGSFTTQDDFRKIILIFMFGYAHKWENSCYDILEDEKKGE